MCPRRRSTADPATPHTQSPVTQLTGPELEIAEHFRVAYEGASTQRRRSRVLEEYVARHAHIAFHPESWLVPLWISWRALKKDAPDAHNLRLQRDARLGLRAIQRGIVEPITGYVGGWVTGARAEQELRAATVAKARADLLRVKQDQQLRSAYRDWRQGRDDPEYQHYLSVIGRRAWQLLVGPHPAAPPATRPDLDPSLAEAVLRTWQSREAIFIEWTNAFIADIGARGLSRALSTLAARVHRIPERELH